MNNIIDQYLSLNERITIHSIPDGANLISIPPSDEMKQAIRPISIIHVNETARQLLLRCDGNKTLREILNELFSLIRMSVQEKDIFIQQCNNFIQQAIDKGYVIQLNDSSPTIIRKSGNTKSYLPLHLSIELTSDCNLKCIYCYRDAGPIQAEYLSGDHLLTILENLYNYGLISVELTGGEPTMHPDFLKILEFCEQKFFRVCLLSNGYSINSQIVDVLKEYPEKVFVQVDIDSYKSNVHDRLRARKGAFEKTVNSVRLLAKANISFRIAMNVTKDNLYDIDETALFAKELGAFYFAMSPMINCGRGAGLDLTFSQEELLYLNNVMNNLHNTHGKFFNFLNPQELLNKFDQMNNCGAGHRTFVLGPTGKVRPCPILPEKYLVIGDLTEQDPLDVFSAPAINRLKDLRSPNDQTCSGCNLEYYCRYCHTRAIMSQRDRDNLCSWISENQLDQYVNFPSAAGEYINKKRCTANQKCFS